MEHVKPSILVIDDQIASVEVHEQYSYPIGATSFLWTVGYLGERGDEPAKDYPFTFEYHSGESAHGSRKYSIDAVKDAIASKWRGQQTQRWALVLLDVRFGDNTEFGFQVLEALRSDPDFSDLPIVMLTSEDADKRE